MTQRRVIKQRSAEVWARAKEAYLAGEPAASVARRFDVGYGNLRYRAHAEGWTRKAILAQAATEATLESRRLAGLAHIPLEAGPASATMQPVTDPAEALTAALGWASAALAAGRADEANTVIRAAEALARLTGVRPTVVQTDRAHRSSADTDAAREAELRQAHDDMQREIERRAAQLARGLLGDESTAPMVHGAFVFRWRARVFGPECADADRRRGEAGGWAARYWREDGSLRLPGEVRDGVWSLMRHRLRADAGLPYAGEASEA